MFSHVALSPPSLSYPLLRLPLPGTGPVEFTTRGRDYTVPSHEPQGDLGEQPDWVRLMVKRLPHLQYLHGSTVDMVHL